MNDGIKRIEQYKGLIKVFADHCDDVIYHYTSAEGLRGIIENREIWLTNTAFVNDTSECRALQEEKRLFVEGDFTNSYVKDKWKNFISDLKIENDNTYIASFSCGDESLDQWRAYGHFRIGFEVKKLIRRSFNLYRCLYSKRQIKDWILKKEKVKEWQGDSLNDEWKRRAAFDLIDAASKKYKNKYFKNEKEVRIISISHSNSVLYSDSPAMFKEDPPIHYRDHPAYKIPCPYVKFFIEETAGQENEQERKVEETFWQMKERNLNEEKNKRRGLLPITEILIGPMQHQKKAEIACKKFLSDTGYENVGVNVSSIPYRGF